MTALGQRCPGQMQGQGVRPLRTARRQQHQPQPLGGDLRVGDPALHQPGHRLVRGALLQPPLDHHGRLVQPRGALAGVLQRPVHLVRSGVQQLELGVDELRQPGPERLPQPFQDPRRGLRHQREPRDGTADERQGDHPAEPGQVLGGDPDEQGQEVDLEADQPQGGAPVAEPAAVHRAEDEHDEEDVTGHLPGGEQRRHRHRGERHREPQRQGDRLPGPLLLADREGGDHRRDGPGDQMLDVRAQQREHGQRQRDRGHRPQPRRQPQQPRVGRGDPVPPPGRRAHPRCRHPDPGPEPSTCARTCSGVR